MSMDSKNLFSDGIFPQYYFPPIFVNIQIFKHKCTLYTVSDYNH